jgi:hypothetical protein
MVGVWKVSGRGNPAKSKGLAMAECTSGAAGSGRRLGPMGQPETVLVGHANDQLLDFSLNPGPARTSASLRAIEFAGHELAVPGQDGLRPISIAVRRALNLPAAKAFLSLHFLFQDLTQYQERYWPNSDPNSQPLCVGFLQSRS